jgi:hypothetical protein
MLRITLALLAFACALPLHAGGYILHFMEPSVTVAVGETTTIRAIAAFSGMTPAPAAVWDWTFSSSDPSIVLVDGRLKSPDSVAPVTITGMRPGIAGITISGTGVALVIEVICGEEKPIRPVVATQTTTISSRVRLALASDVVSRAAIIWFAGRTGDTSRPLASGGATLDYTPSAVGTEYVWADARTACSHSKAEFRIDVTAPRRRASR